MEIKKQRKRSGRSMRSVRGGQGETGLEKILKSPNPFDLSNLTGLFNILGIKTEDNADDIKIADFPLIYRWATFINFLSNKTPEKDEKDIQVELTDEEIILKSILLAEEIRLIKEQKAERESGKGSGSPRPASAKRSRFMNLITKLFNRPSSARPASGRPVSTRPISANSKVKSSNSFMLSPKITTKKVDIPLVADKSLTRIITEFDIAFKGILTVVNDGCQDKGKGSSGSGGSNFKNMMSIVKRLPDIDTTLPHLLQDKNKNLRDRYKTILYLLNTKCTGWRGAICSTAISILRDKDIQSLYDKLKKIADNTIIDNATLLEFIKDVLPIMQIKLKGMDEFKEYLDMLDIIKGNLSDYHPAAKGGKKATKKLILGKERCIYKVQGSNKEHIKYKGALIPVADYKKLMGGTIRI